MPKTTILVESATRERLRQIGRKNQTYDELINELIEMRRTRDSLDSSFGGLRSSESLTA